MGDYQHHAILVSACSKPEDLAKAHGQAIKLLRERRSLVSDIKHSDNGFGYFVIFPSGGKMGGGIESTVRSARDAWKRKVMSLLINWVEVEWGEYPTQITDERYPSRPTAPGEVT